MALVSTLPVPTRLLRGRIENLACTRTSNDFAFDDRDRKRMGLAAIGAALTGSGALAVGLSQVSMDTTEEADLLEFDIDGKHVRAWVWVSVFANGDEVEVVAEPTGDAWYGYAIRRLSDSIVALHPHCSAGRFGHYLSTAKWWGIISSCLIAVVTVMYAVIAWAKSGTVTVGEAIFFCLTVGAGGWR